MYKAPLILLLALSTAILACAKEQGKIECYDRHTRVKRSTITFAMDEEQNKIVKLTQKGRGDYDSHRNVTWDLTSIMENRDGIYCPLSSERVLKNSEGKIIKTLNLKYNYPQKSIDFTIITPKITIKKRFPIKGITVDGTNSLHITASLVENHQPYFYLLTDLGNLYKINIRYLGTENAIFRSKPVKTVRIRLIPDMGILDAFLENAIPASYAWYSTAGEHCRWMRYEGKEVDRDSKNIINFINS